MHAIWKGWLRTLKHVYITPLVDSVPVGAADLLDTSTFGTIKILGLGRPEANVYSYAYAGIDASQVTGMTISDRTITLVMDTQTTFQRMLLYKMLPYKQMRRIWICNDVGIYWIDGYATELPYDEMGHEISSFEIPVFCPYPWFCGEYHELDIILDDDPLHLTHEGDASAGIAIYAQGSVADLERIMSFRLESSKDYFSASTHVMSSVIGPTGGKMLLIDTTPGIGLGTEGRFDAEYLASIDMSADLITIAPNTGVDISLTIRNLNDLTSPCQFLVGWYDTYTAI